MRKKILDKIDTCVKSRIANLEGSEIVDDEIPEIMEMIKKKQPNIHEINLDSNELSDKCADNLKRYLSDFKKLETLSIQYNKIDKTGAISLLSIKKELPKLRILLHGNKINNANDMVEIENLAEQKAFTK